MVDFRSDLPEHNNTQAYMCPYLRLSLPLNLFSISRSLSHPCYHSNDRTLPPSLSLGLALPLLLSTSPSHSSSFSPKSCLLSASPLSFVAYLDLYFSLRLPLSISVSLSLSLSLSLFPSLLLSHWSLFLSLPSLPQTDDVLLIPKRSDY